MSFPEKIPEREAYILEQVQAGNYDVRWTQVISSNAGHTAEFTVMADALKVEGVRVNVSARLEQGIADALGCLLLTPKLADLIWEQRTVTLRPYPREITASTASMLEHSMKIESALEALGGPTDGLIATVGKHWVIDKDLAAHPGKAENYGWHFEGAAFQGIKGETVASLAKDPKTGAYLRLIQGRGWCHDAGHVDYSQTCVLVLNTCRVDGCDMLLKDLLADPSLASLASHNGVVLNTRQAV